VAIQEVPTISDLMNLMDIKFFGGFSLLWSELLCYCMSAMRAKHHPRSPMMFPNWMDLLYVFVETRSMTGPGLFFVTKIYTTCVLSTGLQDVRFYLHKVFDHPASCMPSEHSIGLILHKVLDCAGLKSKVKI